MNVAGHATAASIQSQRSHTKGGGGRAKKILVPHPIVVWTLQSLIGKFVARRALTRKTTAMVVDIAAVTAAETVSVAAAQASTGRKVTASSSLRRYVPRQEESRTEVNEAHLGNVVAVMSGHKPKGAMT